jgi:hypothetical protein
LLGAPKANPWLPQVCDDSDWKTREQIETAP